MRKRSSIRNGTAAVETALMLPILVFLTLGSVDIGQYINMTCSVNEAAREAARIAAACDDIYEIQTGVHGYLQECLPHQSSDVIAEALVITIVPSAYGSTESDSSSSSSSGKNGKGNNNSSSGDSNYDNWNGDIESITSGDSIEITIEFDFNAVRWISGPEYWNGNTLRSTITCRRE